MPVRDRRDRTLRPRLGAALELAAGFHIPQKGRVIINGTDLRDLDLEAVRRHIGWVGQDPNLLSGTIRDKGWKMRGVMYVAIDGDNFIQIQTQDVEPHAEKALQVGEAATQTFKRK